MDGLINTLETTRLWCMYFSLMHLHKSQNQQWRAHIDASEGTNWFMRNCHLGRPRYIVPRVMVF